MKKQFLPLALAVAATTLIFGCRKDESYHKDAGAPSIVVRANDQNRAFPGAEGFALSVSGGRGGRLIHVSNLNDNGAGSLRAAAEAIGARTIVFDLSGTIALEKPIVISSDSVTIAGQSAPGDGITLRNHPLTIAANNVVVRFLRFRLGASSGAAANATQGTDKTNVMIDHCSLSWATDANASFYNNTNFTMQWCIISEALSAPATGPAGYGAIWGGRNASFHHNLIACNDNRNPRFGERSGSDFAKSDLVDFRNNVIYNWKSNSVYGGEAMNINLVNNFYKPGPATPASKAEQIFAIDKNLNTGQGNSNTWGKYYVLGNVVDGHPNPTTDNWLHGVSNQFLPVYGSIPDSVKNTMKLAAALTINNNVVTQEAAAAYERVLALAGASLRRDAVDTRVVEMTRSGSGSNGLINDPSEVGGYPVLSNAQTRVDTDGDGMPDEWEVSVGLDPTFANGRSKNLSNVYENLEVYLNSLVKAIVDEQLK